MYNLGNLKRAIAKPTGHVECPVAGCNRVVEMQRKGDYLRQDRFFCPDHAIYISPSTFEYLNEEDNLLWKDADDQSFLKAARCHKRESRMARDNSEDALTWNVFRYLEKSAQLDTWLSTLVGSTVVNSVPTYWSYSHASRAALWELNKARLEFGEKIKRSSEPDMIVVSEGRVFWIEAKLNAPNQTKPSDPGKTKRYLTGGDMWFDRVFHSEYQAIAVEARRYELLRFWLLGSWMAADMGYEFYLINLVRKKREETKFVRYIKQDERRRFLCTTWENIYSFVGLGGSVVDDQRNTILEYLQNKSGGYSSSGKLTAAFPTLASLAR